MLCVCQVDVGSAGQRRVGYVANLHTQAYQDRDPIIYQVGSRYKAVTGAEYFIAMNEFVISSTGLLARS